MNKTKVMVSGCFDLLHSGHIAFLEKAAEYGKLYVCIGSDQTIFQLKGRATINSQAERLYLLNALACVTEARTSRGSGHLDFLPEIEDIKPDIFLVNTDGHSETKQKTIESRGIQYVVLERLPHEALAPRSTTSLRTRHEVPYRLDLAGGWLDQPFVNQYYPGSVINISLEPDERYERRSGMSSSTRETAMMIWDQNYLSMTAKN